VTPLELALAASGATLVITHSPLGKPLRAIPTKLFRCPLCLGFWLGCLTYTLYSWHTLSLIEIPLRGLMTSFIAYTMSSLATWVDLHDATINATLTIDPDEPEDPLAISDQLALLFSELDHNHPGNHKHN